MTIVGGGTFCGMAARRSAKCNASLIVAFLGCNLLGAIVRFVGTIDGTVCCSALKTRKGRQ